jgi:pilus assembly protein CpaB
MRKLNLTIVAGLIVAVVGAALVVSYGRRVEHRAAGNGQMATVLVAKADLAAGTSAAALQGAVESKQVPQAYVVAHALSTMTQIPPGTVLRGPVVTGSQLSIADFGAANTAAAVQPKKGFVDIAVSVGLTPGVARYIQPGDQVDIFYTGATKDGPAMTKLFASGVRVVSVSDAQPDDSSESSAQQTSDDVLAVVEVVPGEAQKIVHATATGRLYLALSAAQDKHRTSSGTSSADLLASNR